MPPSERCRRTWPLARLEYEVVQSRLASMGLAIAADRLLVMKPIPEQRRPAPHHRAVDLNALVIVAYGGDAVVAPACAATVQRAVLGQSNQCHPRRSR